MVSFDCQICGVDMAIARIRTVNEPPSAAWNLEGANYVGFPTQPWRTEFPDQECQHCTSADRTPSDPQVLRCLQLPLWPDDEDESDLDWVPDDDDPDDEPLEYSSNSDTGVEDENRLTAELEAADDCAAAVNDVYPLSELPDPPRPHRLPNGTWHKGKIYHTGDRCNPVMVDFPGDPVPVTPKEHIAAPSCRSLQGINGNVLSVAQMKNCRNVRFVMPKPKNWKPEQRDQLFEEQGLFYLSGESNGSNWIGGHFMAWRSFHPPRHGLHEINASWEFVGEGCDESDVLRPIAVHSYCLDMYAKDSYARLGRVDLEGLWYWREILTDPDSYGIEGSMMLRRAEVERGRKSWDSPWHHWPGDEWLAANPVEIPRLSRGLDSCRGHAIHHTSAHRSDTLLVALPAEIIEHILSFLDLGGIDAAARTCRALYIHTQPVFKALVSREMPWLWEILENGEYPASRDWPATWDPLCPPGLEPPTLPIDLPSEEDEAMLWSEIVADDPEMEEAAEAAKALSARRRHEIFSPYHARQDAAQREWHLFRANVEAWLRQGPQTPTAQHHGQAVNWRRIHWLCNPETTPLPGLRNRARIWEDCNQVLACVSVARDLGAIERRRGLLHEKLSDPSQPIWNTLDAFGLS